MNRSEQIADLVTALAKAQATIPSIKRDKRAEIKSDKGSYSYSYADLATIMDAIRQPLSEQGLAIIQSVETGDGLVVVETMLAHSSGQWVSHQIGLKAGGDARSVGSAITYARRYGLNLTGVVTEDDDDGERASEHGAAVAPKRTSSATSTQKCPKCGGAMWDNRETKTNPRAPDYKCKDKSCDGAIWQPADPAPPGNGHAPEPKPEAAGWEEVEAGTSPVQPKPQPAPANGAKVKPATLKIANFGPLFSALIEKLEGAGITSDYRRADGGLDYNHALYSLGSMGYAEITAANVGDAIAALEQHILEKSQ